MELEEAVLEAIKLKLTDTFKKVNISTNIEGREVVIRISIPNEIMASPIPKNTQIGLPLQNLDIDAQAAANELLGRIDDNY